MASIENVGQNEQVNLSQTRNGKPVSETGRNDTEQLRRLWEWLFDRSRSRRRGWTYRLAPSIITRSEASLFGMSMPRFAQRVYLDDNHDMFVSMRRKATLCDQAERWGPRKIEEAIPSHRIRHDISDWPRMTRPAWILRHNRPIADSLLRLPEGADKWKGFTTLSAELGLAYGEGKPIVGFPYVMHTKLAGGGMCAQAVCFMASTLLHEYASGVWGIGEITVIALDAASHAEGEPRRLGLTEAREYLLGGLDPKSLAAYFGDDRVGLNAVWQLDIAEPPSETVYPRDRDQTFGEALRAYVQSKMPIILPLDYGRMNGVPSPSCPLLTQSIIETNGLDVRTLGSAESKPARHAVLVVGWGPPRDSTFLINDPASRPCLKATANQLWDAGIYASEKMNTVIKGWFLPILPREISVPLHYWQGRDHLTDPTKINPGLYEVAQSLPTPLRSICRGPGSCNPGRFRLARIQDINISSLYFGDLSVEKFAKPIADSKAILISQLPSTHWCWIQITDRMFAVWDAQRSPPTDSDTKHAERLLLLVYLLEGGNWRLSWRGAFNGSGEYSVTKDAVEESSSALNEPKLNNAIITSFSSSGINHALAEWPRSMLHADCYCFFQQDAEKVLPISRLLRTPRNWTIPVRLSHRLAMWTIPAGLKNLVRVPGVGLHVRRYPRSGRRNWRDYIVRHRTMALGLPHLTALDRMAAARNCSGVASEVANYLHSSCASKDVHIAALSTFLPEIIATDLMSNRACHAIEFLIDLSRELQSRRHPCHTIQLAGGSLIAGLWPGRRTSDGNSEINGRSTEVFGATMMGTRAAIRRLLERLRELAPLAAAADVQFALELDPSPLCVLNDVSGLNELCLQLKATENELVSRVTGLCLDMANWELAGITPSAVGQEIQNRIVHVHICDHGRGDFGDVPLAHLNSVEHFIKWLVFVKSCINAPRPGCYPKFRGTISLELETCRSRGHVDQSVEILREVFTRSGLYAVTRDHVEPSDR